MPTAAQSPAAQTVGLLLADSRLPSGGHVSSSGLEPALMGGLARAQVGDFLLVRARTAALTDAACAVMVRHALTHQPDPSAALLRTDRAWAARTPSGAARQIAAELGRGLVRLATSLWPDAPPSSRWAGGPPVLQ
ncbi:hypothetical protein [Nesterenkonia pannonica]|uniref:urease accessory UreF family protein n=1 Tax=Nesterenkonia pannonica TaxID=1548602 RepID=UPI002164A454|nr:urease accessory UreF family protein [Nesterenkonia pannonica]